ncbi:unnamed protein product, partial [Brugia timori]|uniref:Uncharacterized protein n=1 Tax=Brugia timori TaxID=42155 RepID=A0A0R3R7K4_9BILA
MIQTDLQQNVQLPSFVLLAHPLAAVAEFLSLFRYTVTLIFCLLYRR